MMKIQIKVLLLFLIVQFQQFDLFSQPKSNEMLLLEKRPDSIKSVRRNAKFGITNSKNILIKYNPFFLIGGGMMFFYQRVISQQLSATCGYRPSCSEMGKELIKKYGIVKGLFCTADRMTRCNKVCFAEFQKEEFCISDGKIHETVDIYK